METTSHQAKILVVDDDPQFRSYLVDAIATLLPTSEVNQAGDSFQAGKIMASIVPDLVFMDYAMPGINGAAVTVLIRSDPTFSNTKIVAITGFANRATLYDLQRSGVDLIMHKPASLKDIETTLAHFNLLSRSE